MHEMQARSRAPAAALALAAAVLAFERNRDASSCAVQTALVSLGRM